jgi:hypothetical protein
MWGKLTSPPLLVAQIPSAQRSPTKLTQRARATYVAPSSRAPAKPSRTSRAVEDGAHGSQSSSCIKLPNRALDVLHTGCSVRRHSASEPRTLLVHGHACGWLLSSSLIESVIHLQEQPGTELPYKGWCQLTPVKILKTFTN